MKNAFIAISAAAIASAAFAKPRISVGTEPLWSLTKDGAALVENGSRALTPETAFEIPHSVIPDAGAFSVKVDVTFGNEWNDDDERLVSLLSQRVGETGWALSLRGGPHSDGGAIVVDVGGETMRDGKIRFVAHPGETHSFAVKSREGVVTVYMDEILRFQWFKRVVPNLEPIRVGGWFEPADSATKPWKGISITSLDIYGPDETFMAAGEAKLPAVGSWSGKGWFVNGPGEFSDKARPRVLCYGDSIMLGYSPGLRRTLEGKAYVFDWCNSCMNPGPVDERIFTEVASLAPFDFIFFNNGLHSLHWRPEIVSDEKAEECYRSMVRAFRKGAPDAKLVYLMTTPLLKAVPKGEPATEVGPGNAVVLRLNAIAGKIMAEEGVEVIDLYALLIDHLDYANGGGDIYHWTKDRGYPVIYNAVAERVLRENQK